MCLLQCNRPPQQHLLLLPTSVGLAGIGWAVCSWDPMDGYSQMVADMLLKALGLPLIAWSSASLSARTIGWSIYLLMIPLEISHSFIAGT